MTSSREYGSELERWLLHILTENLGQTRYALFENAIKEFHTYCYHQVRQQIEASDNSNKLHSLGELNEIYENNVKNYPEQNQQAILDNQIPGPIARNAGIAVKALCHQMHGFAPKSQDRACWKSDEKRIQTWLLQILSSTLQESRYAVFENLINAYEAKCYQHVREQINASSNPNKLDVLDKLAELYEKHVRNYAKQHRQAILDNQPPEPIARSAVVNANALCHQMHAFALSLNA